MPVKIAVFVSGGGTNLQSLINAQAEGRLKSGEISLVAADREGIFAIERAKNAGIPYVVVARVGFKSSAEYERALLKELQDRDIDLLVLAGYIQILSKNFVEKYPERIINIHPSLIPAHCGKGFYGLRVHESVLRSGDKFTGATVHFVNELPDGGRVIMQKKVEVMEGDTPETLQKRVMEQAESHLLPIAAEAVCSRLLHGVVHLLKKNRYPGRGILIGRSESGKIALAYFIMGRSPNSRNRIFVKRGDELRIEIIDEKKLSDPSLILYTPLKIVKNSVIITNGDQTDTIADAISEGGSFESALMTRSFEPDEPNFTPRISGVVNNGAYKLSILKTADGGKTCERHFFNYESCPGFGHLIHTYEHDGDPLPSFLGEPRRVKISGDIDEFSNELWESLDENNRVALYVRFMDKNGYADRLYNSYGGETKP